MRVTTLISVFVICCFIASCNKRLSPSLPRAIAWQGENYLWVIMGGEVVQWDIKHQNMVSHDSEVGAMNLLVTAEGQVWAYRFGTELFESGYWVIRNRDTGSVTMVQDMVQTSDGNVWAATATGYFVWNEQIKEWQLSSIPYPGRTLIEGSDGSLWFGLVDKGLLQAQGDEIVHWTDDDTLIDNEVYSLLVASDNSVWVGTRWGVHRWNGSEWQKWNELGNLDADGPVISQIFETESGEIWVAVETKMAKWDGQSWLVFETPRGVNSFVETGEGTLWAACDNGLYRWDGLSWHEYKETGGISDSRVSYLVEGTNGILYAATISGLYQYIPVEDRWHPFPEPES